MMTIAATTTLAPATARRDWLFLTGAVLATALLVALVLIDGQPASAALLVLGFGLGAAFLKAEFSFTASWRRFLVHGEAGGLLVILLLIALTAVAVVPVAASWPHYGGSIAPLGPSLVIGAFVFGVGMQLANGCGSGTLYTVGGGSGRMLITLACFIVGSVLGSMSLPPFLRMGGLDPVLASDYFGPWGGLAVTLASIAAVALVIVVIARRRGAPLSTRGSFIAGALVIAALMIGVFFAGGHPWSVTFGYTVWGGKLAMLAGADLSQFEFWQWPGPKHALSDSLLGDTASLTNLGMIFGAMAAAAFSAPFAHRPWPPLRSLAAAAIGGMLMGWGARLGFGCNIGAFVGGVASGSLHGWIWFLAALGGCTIGIKCRPWFGLSRD
ncbi:MAG TPA: YeeE/YedE family protein [Xanthobacteraceae bacterium]|nr:YeeE/YedE family protein [Xanthobacteraceae bacterium]